MELHQIRADHSLNVEHLRDMKEKYATKEKSPKPDNKRLNALEQHLLRVEKRVDDLLGEYKYVCLVLGV